VTAADEALLEPEAPAGRSSRQLVAAVRDLCPYLESDSGWRSTSAQRDLRCQAVTPAVRVALDKQRRLCTKAAHHDCPTYLAARTARARDRVDHRQPGVAATDSPPDLWRFSRTAPVAIDDGRIGLPIAIAGRQRTVPQAGLGAIMVAVLAILVGVRVAGGGTPASSDAGANPPPGSAPVGAAASRSQPPASISTPSASPRTPTRSPTEAPSVSPTGAVAGATATAPARTYRVRSGDTLFAIAQRFGTTVRALQQLNEIEDPSRLRVGQILQIP